jgi:hypothetical protein
VAKDAMEANENSAAIKVIASFVEAVQEELYQQGLGISAVRGVVLCVVVFRLMYGSFQKAGGDAEAMPRSERLSALKKDLSKLQEV